MKLEATTERDREGSGRKHRDGDAERHRVALERAKESMAERALLLGRAGHEIDASGAERFLDGCDSS